MIHDEFLKDYENAKISYKYCVDKILELKKYKKFYVGVTHDPKIRLKEHAKEHAMSHMYLLCKVPTKSKTKRLEQKLIKRFNTKMNINQSGGGEGITEEVNYIYVLFN